MFTRSILAATLLLTATPVVSADVTEKEYNLCQTLASLAQEYAEMRDKGVSKEKMVNTINKISDDASGDLYVVDFIYQFPKESPREEGNSMYGYCIEAAKED